MQLLCTRCGIPIPGADVDLQKGVGLCRPCGELVPIPNMSIEPMQREAPRLYKPEGLKFTESAIANVYEASISPNRLPAIPMIFFCVFWDGFMAVWYGIAIYQRIWIMMAFGLLHLGAGIVITHKTLMALFNTPRVRMAAGQFDFRNGPIPFGGSFSVPLRNVESFTVVDTSTRRAASCAISANMIDGVARKFNVGVDAHDAVQYVAQSLNAGLAIARAASGDPDSPYRG